MWIKPSAVLGAFACMLVLAACSNDDPSDGRPLVIASFYPFAFVAEQVGGDTVQVDNLTPPGAEPHDLELSPQQVADLTNASLVIFENGFQPAVDDGVDQANLSDQAKLDVADVVNTMDATGSDEGEFDPHVWLDPVMMQQITQATAQRLSEIDPAHKQQYERNADRLERQLRDLDTAYREGLADCQRRTIVTSHDAFGYLARRYNLEQIPISGIDPHAEPSPAEQAHITDLVEQEGITTIFTETLVSDAVAESIANETGASVATLDPIEGLSDATSHENYFDLMRSNLEAIQKANGCA
ncbi:MAG TPA: metal ABC transporter substrate-binding protein [Nocardioidaceae bacterium]|nr:metal ABC transporter substrate-binding protein [Nocardioidaceae bacterium]